MLQSGLRGIVALATLLSRLATVLLMQSVCNMVRARRRLDGMAKLLQDVATKGPTRELLAPAN